MASARNAVMPRREKQKHLKKSDSVSAISPMSLLVSIVKKKPVKKRKEAQNETGLRFLRKGDN
jgi:hypothetical protein